MPVKTKAGPGSSRELPQPFLTHAAHQFFKSTFKGKKPTKPPKNSIFGGQPGRLIAEFLRSPAEELRVVEYNYLRIKEKANVCPFDLKDKPTRSDMELNLLARLLRLPKLVAPDLSPLQGVAPAGKHGVVECTVTYDDKGAADGMIFDFKKRKRGPTADAGTKKQK